MKLVSVKFITESSNCIFCDVTFSRKTWFTKRKELTKRYMLEKHEYSKDKYGHIPYAIDTGDWEPKLRHVIREEMILAHQKFTLDIEEKPLNNNCRFIQGTIKTIK